MEPEKIEQAERAAMAAIAQTQAEIDADAAVDDPSIPPMLTMLARRVNESVEGSRVTAIKRTTSTKYVPAWEPKDARDGIHYEWSMRRLTGRLRKDDPPMVCDKSEMWAFVIHGNPIEVEGWLKDEGYPEAFAISPNACLVVRVSL